METANHVQLVISHQHLVHVHVTHAHLVMKPMLRRHHVILVPPVNSLLMVLNVKLVNLDQSHQTQVHHHVNHAHPAMVTQVIHPYVEYVMRENIQISEKHVAHVDQERSLIQEVLVFHAQLVWVILVLLMCVEHVQLEQVLKLEDNVFDAQKE